MPSRQSTLLLALLLQLGLCGAFLGAHAFYMPPAFDLEAVPATFPAYPAAAAIEPAPHADAPNGTAGTGTGTGVAASDGGGGAFAVPGNATTADDAARRTAAAPATLGGRDVWDPEVTAPDAATVWTVGATDPELWNSGKPVPGNHHGTFAPAPGTVKAATDAAVAACLSYLFTS